jgi:hypothetical protein
MGALLNKPKEHARPSVHRLDQLANLLDDRFRVPGTRWRFGLDGLLGLVPGAGDAITAVLSGYIVWSAWRIGVSKGAWARMAGNMLLDLVIGAVPVLGDLFDFGWKANRRNLRILREDLRSQPGQTPTRRS